MGENRQGMGKILATPHAGWKKRCEIAKGIGQNTFVFVRKHQFSKTETCCGSILYLSKNILHLRAVCTGLSFCLWLSLALTSAQFSFMKSFEREGNCGGFTLSWKGILFLAGSHAQSIWAAWVQVSWCGPVLKSLHQSALT